MMAIYSIKDLEKFSGIKAHTLRAWEKRYAILSPQRTETNVRYYLDQDLQHLLKIVFLRKNGYKISKIAQLSKEEISEEIENQMSVKQSLDGQHDALTLSILELDRYRVEQILNHKIQQLGFEETLFTIIYPLLEKVNLLWISGSLEQFHETFLIQIIRQKIVGQMDVLSIDKKDRNLKALVLASAGAEELIVLLSDYYFRKEGYNVINLGVGVGTQEIPLIHKSCPDPEFVLLLINHGTSREESEKMIYSVQEVYAQSQILIYGYMINMASVAPNVHITTSVLEIEKIIHATRASHINQ